jgi:hypothetical protein
MYHTILNFDDCKPLQHDINSVYNWCLVNGMKINLGKTTIISFSRKTNSIYFNYKFCNNLITHVKWVHCHHGMTRPQVADGEDGLQIWRVAANVLNKQSRTADSGWPSSLGVGWGSNNPPP